MSLNTVKQESEFNQYLIDSAGESIIIPTYQLQYLKHHPLNEFIYDKSVDFNPNDEKFINLINSLKQEYQNNKKYGNTELIIINKQGFVFSGHRRLEAAKVAGVPVQIQIKDDDLLPSTSNFKDRLEQLTKYNKNKETQRDESSYRALIFKFKGFLKIIEKSDPISCDREIKKQAYDLMKEISGFDIQNFRTMYNIYSNYDRQDLIDKVDKGELTPTKALRIAKEEMKPKEVINPQQFDWPKEFVKNPKLAETIKEGYRSIYKNNSENTIQGVSIFDEDYGFESNAITTLLSHSMMVNVCASINKLTDIKCFTASHKGTGSPDIEFPDLTDKAKKINPLYANETMEIKGCSWKNNDARWSGGPLFQTRDHRDWYILFVTEERGKRFAIMLVQVQQDDVKHSNNGKRECSIHDLMKNHYHKKDYYMIAGDIFESSTKGKFTFEFEKV